MDELLVRQAQHPQTSQAHRTRYARQNQEKPPDLENPADKPQ